MRPGQTAPECVHHRNLHGQPDGASMRPGQTAPECRLAAVPLPVVRFGFNEAGADCPGMRRNARNRPCSAACFNEAGADCPGMPRDFYFGQNSQFTLQ